MNELSNHNSSLHILYSTIKNEGFLTLYRGWIPAYLRLGPHALICFPILEKIREIMGLNYI